MDMRVALLLHKKKGAARGSVIVIRGQKEKLPSKSEIDL